MSGTTNNKFYDKVGPHRAITSTELASVHLGNSFIPLLYHVMRKSYNNSNGFKVRGFTLRPTCSNQSLCSRGMIFLRLLKFLIMSKVVSFMVTFLERGGVIFFNQKHTSFLFLFTAHFSISYASCHAAKIESVQYRMSLTT